MEVHSFEATQKGSGANMSVDVAANVADAGSGVAAYVKGIGVTAQGPYPIPAHTAVINEAIGANASGNPRIDQVVLEIKDATHDGGASNLVQTRVLAGTATSGANLTNRTGAANLATSCPGGCILLADVLVANGAVSITNANIRDRRKWARGAYVATLGDGSGDVSAASATPVSIVTRRVECSGAPVELVFVGTVYFSASGATCLLEVRVDGVAITGGEVDFVSTATTSQTTLTARVPVTPTPGSRVFEVVVYRPAGTGTVSVVNAGGTQRWVMVIDERIRQNTPNNAVTTG